MTSEFESAYSTLRSEYPFSTRTDFLKSKKELYRGIYQKIEEISNQDNAKILSLGSGACEYETILSQTGHDVTAFDDLGDSWHTIGQNQRRIEQFAAEMDIDFYVQYVSEESQIPDSGDYDIAIILDVIEHLNHSPRGIMNTAVGALKNQGTLLITTPNAIALRKRIAALLGYSMFPEFEKYYWSIGEFRGHIREYTPSELRQLFNHHNLLDIEIELTNRRIEMELENTTGGKYYRNFLYHKLCNLWEPWKHTVIITGKKPSNWGPTKLSYKKIVGNSPWVEKHNLDNIDSEKILDSWKSE